MRCLWRNKVPFYYCLYIGKAPIVDSDGYETGEYTDTYATPVQLMGNISAAKGETHVEQFGVSIDYDKVIIVEDGDCPIDEHTALFVDSEPTLDTVGNPLFDYTVVKVAKSRNSGISYAIKKVR